MTQPATVVTVYARTDLGKTRDHNEDTFLVADLTTGKSTLDSESRQCSVGPRGLLFLVADGMGGAAAGELASAMAADLIFGHMVGTWAREPDDAVSVDRFTLRLREAVELANLQIHSYAKENAEFRGMGSTATVAGVFERSLYLAQVGDSRGYLVREGRAVQLTKDQSLTQRLVDAGELTEEEAEKSARRNIILQALGPDPKIRVDLTYQELQDGDILVLCSDGLSGVVKRDEIATRVSAAADLETVGDELIALANERGGPDNITVVLARFAGAGLAPSADQTDAAYRVFDTGEMETLEAPPPLAPVPPPAPPARRTGAPVGMAMLVTGIIVVLLALFLALAG